MSASYGTKLSRKPRPSPFDVAGPAKGFLQIGITQVEALKPRCPLINQRVYFFLHDASLTHGFYSFITAAIAYRRFAQSIRRSSTFLNDRLYRQQPFAAGTSDVSHADDSAVRSNAAPARINVCFRLFSF